MTPVQLIRKLFSEVFYENSDGNFVRCQDGSALYELDKSVADEIKRLMTLEQEDKPV